MMSKQKHRPARLRVNTVQVNTHNRTIRRPEIRSGGMCVKTRARIVVPKPIPVYPHLMPPIGEPMEVDKCEGRYMLFYLADVEDAQSGERKKIVIREGEAYEV